MTSLFLVILAGYAVGAAPTAEWASLLLANIRRALRHPAHNLEWMDPPQLARLGVELLQALAAFGLGQLAGGGRLGLALAGWGVVAGNVWPWPVATRAPGRYLRGSVAGAAVLLFVSPQLFIAGCVVWACVHILSRDTATATIVAGFAVPVAALYWRLADLHFVYATIAVGLIGYRPLTRRRLFRVRLRRAVRIGVYLTLIGSLLLLAYANRYVYRGFGPPRDILRHGPSTFPVIALTFDDGPDAHYTPLVLDVLREKDVRATFFCVGRHVEENPELARRIVEEGHEIGNHSQSHRNMWRMPTDAVQTEIDLGEAAILAATGRVPVGFRPPRGLYNQAVLDWLAVKKQPLILWSLSSQDWAEMSSRTIVNRVVGNVGNGDILLFHDSGDLFGDVGGDRAGTIQALPVIIDELKQRGFLFVTITEMMILTGLVEDDDVAR